MRSILLFEVALGLKVNLGKSSIIGVGQCLGLEELASTLDCQVAKPNSRDLWALAIQKFECRLASWKGRYLSKGGKITLLKTALSNFPVYFLSLFSPPKAIVDQLERIQRNFLWDSHEGNHKFHLVGWNLICKPIFKGGLSSHPIQMLSKDLLGKWLWRFCVEKNQLWRKVIEDKYKTQMVVWVSQIPIRPAGVMM